MKHETFYDGRIKIIAAILLGLMAIFVVRLFYLQVIQHEKYENLARLEQQRRYILPAERGEIYAMNGDEPVRLVLNEPIYTVFADPEMIANSGADVQKIANVMNEVAGAEVSDDLRELLTADESRYEVLAKGITRKQAEMIKKKEFSGIGFTPDTRRVYPEKSLAAQTLGFVNAEGKGQYGIEQYMNEELKGEDGLLQSVTDVSNVPLTVGKDNIYREPKDGDNIVLSIDRNVQSFTEDALKKGLEKAGATTGSAVVMDPNTGKIMAMANYPTYNPAEYYRVQDAAAFTNGIISVPYEPASVIKTFVFAAAFDKNVASRSTTFTNTDSVKIDDKVINNALKGMTGTRTLQEAYNWSLNTGSVYAAQQLGGGQLSQKAREIMYSYYHDKFGLGVKTGVEVAGEAKGYVVPPNVAEGNAVRYSNMTFGQGLDVTMLQVGAAFGSVINGGKYYQPSVLAGEVVDDRYVPTPSAKPLRTTVSEQTSAEVRAMAVEGRKNFFGSADDKKGYMIGGKTGTSQQIKNGKYVFNETVGSYLGFGGDSAPRYVIMVQVAAPDKKMEGGLHAGPIFTDISNWMIDYLKLQPQG